MNQQHTSKQSPFTLRPTLFLASLILVTLMFAGCTIQPIQPEATNNDASVMQTATPAAEEEAPVADTDIDTDTDTAADAAELEALVSEALELDKINEESQYGGIDGVNAFPLEKIDASAPQLWVAHTFGMRSFEPLQNHVVAIYVKDESGWQQLASLDFTDSEGDYPSEGEQSDAGDPATYMLGPDYLDEMGVQQVFVEPTHVWLEVQGGAGAHSGTYHLLAYADDAITIEAKFFSVSPGSGQVTDLNGDGILEVKLDTSDPYVFCYACGVTVVQYNILQWDGTHFVPVTLSPLPASAPADQQEANDQAIALAEAGLWKDALAMIDTIDMSGDVAPELAWNAIYIRLNTEAKLAVIEDERTAFPLLSQLFYGDYAAVLNIMSAYTPEEVFSTTSPLIVGTPAESDLSILSERLITSAEGALTAQPELGEAYLVRAWGNFLVSGATESVKADVARAAELLPNNEFVIAANTYIAAQ